VGGSLAITAVAVVDRLELGEDGIVTGLDHGQVLQAMEPGIARLHHGGASCPAGLLSRR
jgi:hypothetical protein